MKILLEHSEVAGTIVEDSLIYGYSGFSVLNEMDLHESVNNGVSIVKFKGKFQEADAINKNKRSYPYAVLDSNIKRLQETIKSGGLVGELDHPTDSIVHFSNASHKVTKLWWEGKTLMGEGAILNTPSGKILRSLIDNGVRVGISSRGVGNGKVNEEGILVIGESYRLITFDAVADPSTYSAFQEKIKEEISVNSQILQHNIVKNENSNLYTNKDLLVACFGNIIRKQTKEIKARLS